MGNQNHQIIFRCNDSLFEFINEMARKSGFEKSEVIRFGLTYWKMDVQNGVHNKMKAKRFQEELDRMGLFANAKRGPKPKGKRKEESEQQ